MKFWWPLPRTGKPFLFVKNIDVGTITDLTGSPSQRSSTLDDGRSAASSRETPSFFEYSHAVRNVSHLQNRY